MHASAEQPPVRAQALFTNAKVCAACEMKWVAVKQKKVQNMGVHMETESIEGQQPKVRRAHHRLGGCAESKQPHPGGGNIEI